jgi:predicted anti-sigma-YlaC factor YlaD
MTCSEFRAAAMIADPAALRGEGGGMLQQHLDDCPDCRQLALMIEDRTTRLAAMLLTRRQSHVPNHASHASRRRLASLALLPVAAVLLGMWLVARPDQQATRARNPGTITTASGVSVVPPKGQKAVVIPSADPKVTIIWLSAGGTE